MIAFEEANIVQEILEAAMARRAWSRVLLDEGRLLFPGELVPMITTYGGSEVIEGSGMKVAGKIHE